MILTKYDEAFRALTPAELAIVLEDMAPVRPELYELGDFESGQELLDYCRQTNISQAEVIMCMARDTRLPAISAIERLCMCPMDRRSPTQVERERHVASPPPRIVPISAKTEDADTHVIRLLTTHNPKRAGTEGHVRFALYRDGMSVAQFLAAGGRRADVRWDQERNFIRLDAPTPITLED